MNLTTDTVAAYVLKTHGVKPSWTHGSSVLIYDFNAQGLGTTVTIRVQFETFESLSLCVTGAPTTDVSSILALKSALDSAHLVFESLEHLFKSSRASGPET